MPLLSWIVAGEHYADIELRLGGRVGQIVELDTGVPIAGYGAAHREG